METQIVKQEERLLRLKQIIGDDGYIPVSKSTWWAGVQSGLFPKPLKLGPRTTVWRLSDIEELMRNGVSSESLRPLLDIEA